MLTEAELVLKWYVPFVQHPSDRAWLFEVRNVGAAEVSFRVEFGGDLWSCACGGRIAESGLRTYYKYCEHIHRAQYFYRNHRDYRDLLNERAKKLAEDLKRGNEPPRFGPRKITLEGK